MERVVPVPPMSADGASAFSRLLASADPAWAWHAAIRVGDMPDTDRAAIVAHVWTMTDSPTENMSEKDWIQVFRAAGFFSYPPLVVAGNDGSRVPVDRPRAPVTLYRGSTEVRARRMSWAFDSTVAATLGRRHSRYGPAVLYKATVLPLGILAYLERRGEGWTVVVDPAYLTTIETVGRIDEDSR